MKIAVGIGLSLILSRQKMDWTREVKTDSELTKLPIDCRRWW
jgi:hypothetical protein